MWTTIHMASGIEEANQIKSILKEEGFLVKIQFVMDDGEAEIYEILAPEIEAEDIHEVFRELNIF